VPPQQTIVNGLEEGGARGQPGAVLGLCGNFFGAIWAGNHFETLPSGLPPAERGVPHGKNKKGVPPQSLIFATAPKKKAPKKKRGVRGSGTHSSGGATKPSIKNPHGGPLVRAQNILCTEKKKNRRMEPLPGAEGG